MWFVEHFGDAGMVLAVLWAFWQFYFKGYLGERGKLRAQLDSSLQVLGDER